MTAVTIVVPTRDRPQALAQCLAALDAQTCELEIVVVDDGSRDEAAVAEAVARSPRTRLVRRDGSGAAAARNAGVDAATGDALCFTDDDCEPEPAWAAELVAALDAGAAVASGRTVAADPRNAAALAAETIAGYLAERAPAFAATNNVACMRELALAVRFDERFDGAGGEDREWCTRLAAQGHRIARVPTAVVRHRPQLTPRRLLAREVRYGARGVRFRSATPGESLARPSFYVGLLRRGFDEGAAVGALVAATQVAAAAGALSERLRRRRRSRAAG